MNHPGNPTPTVLEMAYHLAQELDDRIRRGDEPIYIGEHVHEKLRAYRKAKLPDVPEPSPYHAPELWTPAQRERYGAERAEHPLLEPVASCLRALEQEFKLAVKMREGALDAQAQADKRFFAMRAEVDAREMEIKSLIARKEELQTRIARAVAELEKAKRMSPGRWVEESIDAALEALR